MNPFVDIPEFPDFPAMTPDKAREALPCLIDDAEKGIVELEARAGACWEDLFVAPERLMRPLSDAWRYISHLSSVCDNDEWRKLQQEFQPKIIEVSLRFEQSRKFYDLMVALRDGGKLGDVRRRIADHAIRNAEESGVGLDGEKRTRYNEIVKELSSLALKFSNNVLDATKSFSMVVPTVENLPEALADSIKCDGGYRLTIDGAVYPQAMMHLKDRAVREKLCRARAVRASSGDVDNTPLIDRRLVLCRELAQLLGYESYAELSTASKCARTPEAVTRMLDELTLAAKPAALREERGLAEYATRFGMNTLEVWDRAYYAERMREELYSYNEEELARYFNFPQVLEGLFSLTKRLFGVTVTDQTGKVPVWHPDVRFFAVHDETGAEIAHFYLDPYVRPESKQGGAWMNEFRTRRSGERPVAVICCNQAKPDSKGRSLMMLRDVETLFHEFGHALQHILTKVEEPAASGINMVEWDAVEVASQFMENWCYDRATLKSLAAHVDTHEQIPDELVEKIRAARNYRAGSACMRQLAFAKTDMALYAPSFEGAPDEVKHRVFDECTVKVLPEDRFLQSFTHIFCGGYAAGYYSYKWSEVMSADCFGAFIEVGLENDDAIREVGRRFRDTVLALGGSMNAMDVFKLFRGREPGIKALLSQQGLMEDES